MTGDHSEACVDAAALHCLTDGVHAWIQPDGTWWINNAGVIADDGQALIVDTCATAERTRRFLAAVDVATHHAAVRFAVNTHEHGDHTYGNWLLPDATVLFGHPNMRAGLAVDAVIEACPPLWQPVPDWGAESRRLPDVTITADTVVHLGARAIQVRHPGHAAHTTGDLVVWLPDDRILFAGDLIFAHLTPLVMAGSVRGARDALEWIAAIAPATIVPGHGPVITGDEIGRVLEEHDRYYRFVEALAAEVVDSSRTVTEVARAADLGEFAVWPDAERLVLNLHRAVAEAGGPDFDLLQAFADAIGYNGGPLATHVCCVH
ncbi:MAG: MBL fold metallo-hydrolase [Actinobacteria bacterium]|nr:MBL fold metallo-hydrolase [Actinomycetota bacterium]